MPTAEFPNNLVIELLREHTGQFRAEGVHVTGIPVVMNGPRPQVRTTVGLGETPVDALDALLDGICRGESVVKW